MRKGVAYIGFLVETGLFVLTIFATDKTRWRVLITFPRDKTRWRVLITFYPDETRLRVLITFYPYETGLSVLISFAVVSNPAEPNKFTLERRRKEARWKSVKKEQKGKKKNEK